MAYEDVDYCLRAWQAGIRVIYFPAARLYHHESVTRGSEVGERERASQRVFWERWDDFFNAREVRTADGRLRVVYVTEDTGIGGGHRDIFEHLNRLLDRGHEVALYTLGDEPDWFPLRAPVHSFEYYEELVQELAQLDAIKVATWWNTAGPGVAGQRPARDPRVLRAGHRDLLLPRRRGRAPRRARLLPARVPLHDDLLLERGAAARAGSGVGADPPRDRSRDLPPAGGRRAPPGPGAGARALEPAEEPAPDDRRLAGAAGSRARSCACSGSSRELAAEEGITYVESPSDERVNELFNEATVFIQTSTHEGFALPPLESMATGGAVVCTDAHGNRDFCVDEGNCLMPEPDVGPSRTRSRRLLEDPELRRRLGEAGHRDGPGLRLGAADRRARALPGRRSPGPGR